MDNKVKLTENEEKIFYDFAMDIIENSKPMPSDFAKLVNENFWNLI